MVVDLRNRSFLKLLDFSPDEIRFLLDLAAELKAAKVAGTETQRLRGRNIALIFEKTSTRTRVSFEVAAYDQGAHVTYLGPSGTQIGAAAMGFSVRSRSRPAAGSVPRRAPSRRAGSPLR